MATAGWTEVLGTMMDCTQGQGDVCTTSPARHSPKSTMPTTVARQFQKFVFLIDPNGKHVISAIFLNPSSPHAQSRRSISHPRPHPRMAGLNPPALTHHPWHHDIPPFKLLPRADRMRNSAWPRNA